MSGWNEGDLECVMVGGPKDGRVLRVEFSEPTVLFVGDGQEITYRRQAVDSQGRVLYFYVDQDRAA